MVHTYKTYIHAQYVYLIHIKLHAELTQPIKSIHNFNQIKILKYNGTLADIIAL